MTSGDTVLLAVLQVKCHVKLQHTLAQREAKCSSDLHNTVLQLNDAAVLSLAAAAADAFDDAVACSHQSPCVISHVLIEKSRLTRSIGDGSCCCNASNTRQPQLTFAVTDDARVLRGGDDTVDHFQLAASMNNDGSCGISAIDWGGEGDVEGNTS